MLITVLNLNRYDNINQALEAFNVYPYANLYINDLFALRKSFMKVAEVLFSFSASTEKEKTTQI